ncbi:MAG: hypothetical protein K2X99_12295 [Gemmatimonadaceae bacterium]|nr:hypothetical protein [Gemmatimonadaceae bacterium]
MMRLVTVGMGLSLWCVALNAQSPALPSGRTAYRTLDEVNAELLSLATAHPTRVRRFALANPSVTGQTVWALEVAARVTEPSGRPVFLMTGLHHAREWPTVELSLELVHDVLARDGADSTITRLLDAVRLIVVPVVNPDGYVLSRSMKVEQKRKNCRLEGVAQPTLEACGAPEAVNAGVDLNRNYGAFWGAGGASPNALAQNYRGPSPFSEPEIRNIRDLMASEPVVIALSNHTPDAKVLRVPSAAEEPVPADVVVYDSLAQALGTDLKWDAGPWPKVYYVASGTMEEQGYYSAGTLAFTFEHAPGQRSFHPPYSFVVDQYHGTGAYPGSSARAAFLRLYAAAADARLHSVLDVQAPAGATLTLTKSFELQTAGVLRADSSRAPAIPLPTTLRATMVVPRGRNAVVWHVNPSVRPSQQAQAFIDERWTVSCVLGTDRASAEVRVERGARAAVDLRACGRGR